MVGRWSANARAFRAALLNPMPCVRRLARKLQSDAIVLEPIVPRTIPRTSERDVWEERFAAAEEARFARSAYWPSAVIHHDPHGIFATLRRF
ncbi:MAG: hypothetical protein ACOYJ6_10650 [Caulobacterales bacterium]|jgi:hypothetical protein